MPYFSTGMRLPKGHLGNDVIPVFGRWLLWGWALALVANTNPLTAQPVPKPNFVKTKKIANRTTPQWLDSALIIPGSLRACDTTVSLQYQYLPRTHSLAITPVIGMADSLCIQYQVWQQVPTQALFLRNLSRYQALRYYFDSPEVKEIPQAREEIFSTPGLSKTGSLTRGISFGNSQSVLVNSQLNLQMQGRLNEDLLFTAVISDQAVPFQPEGNTQTIRQFDRVYVQLEHRHWGKLLAGDILLQARADQYFGRYFKNVQGIQLSAKTTDTSLKGLTTAAVAIAKGKFASITIPALEGIQGPYQIRNPDIGANVVITANSERVFLDGKLLQRGFNRDYVIDYNTGEITFTNTVLITRFSRIKVDFEYLTQDYSRTITQFGHSQLLWRSKRAPSLSFDYYQEQDNPNRPLAFTPSPTLVSALGNLQYGATQAAIPGETPATDFVTGQIYYIKIAAPDGKDSIFQSTNQNLPRRYNVIFNRLPNSDYRLQSSATNGRIFIFAGRGLGDYAPVRLITLPNTKRITTLSLAQPLGRYQSLKIESAFAAQNLNRYAQAGNASRNDGAVKAAHKLLSLPLSSRWRWSNEALVEWLGKQFRPIDRFRPIEFEREWAGQAGDTLAASDLLTQTIGTLERDPSQSLRYRAAIRRKGENVQGEILDLQAQWRLPAELWVKLGHYRMDNRGPLRQAIGRRYLAAVQWRKKAIVPGYEFTQEQSLIRNQGVLLFTNNDFTQHSLSLTGKDTGRFAPKVLLIQREDRLPINGEMRRATRSQMLQASSQVQSKAGNSLQVNLTARQLRNLIDSLVTQSSAPENTLMGRLDWNGWYWNRCLRSELTYTSNNGRELLREYRYILSPLAGQGTHYYLGDLNGNGLEDLDEFVEATRPEQRLYIKVFVPTNTYTRAFAATLNYKFNLTAPPIWASAGGWKKWASKISHLTTILADQRTTRANALTRLNPLNFDAEGTLGGNRQWRSATFYDRGNPNFGLEWAYYQQDSRQLAGTGFERRFTRENRLQGRKNLTALTTLTLTVVRNTRGANSDFLANRNYLIRGQSAQMEWAFQPDPFWRSSFMTQYISRQNASGIERTRILRIGADLRLAKAQVRTINAQAAFSRILFQGETADSPVAYDMLEALVPGDNLTWNVNWQQKLTNGLQLQLSYDGRKSPNLAVIHLGRVQVTALF